jgi:hypothetical protein
MLDSTLTVPSVEGSGLLIRLSLPEPDYKNRGVTDRSAVLKVGGRFVSRKTPICLDHACRRNHDWRQPLLNADFATYAKT